MKHYGILYFSTLIVIGIFDALWINGIAKDFYKSRMGDLLEINTIPAVLFYLLYPIGILIFVHPQAGTWQWTIFYGALFGLFAYGTYDLTNLATLRGWSLQLALVDTAWGAFVTAMGATAGKLVADYFES